MLFENYSQQGLLLNTSVLGATSMKGVGAFRGDLVLKEGLLREGSNTDRKPPELVMKQTAALADSEKILFISGLLEKLEDVPAFTQKYASVLTADTQTLFFVENIAASIQTDLAGVLFKFLPYKEGMIWNETLELLYIEKSDLKGQSAEDKVVTVYEAAKSFKIKAEAISYEQALTQTIVVKKSAAVGPV